MAWALIHKDRVVEVKDNPFPVNEKMEWIEVDPAQVKENYLYVEKTFIEPEPPVIKPPEPEPINYIDQMIQTITNYCLGKIDRETLDITFQNYMAVLNNVSTDKS